MSRYQTDWTEEAEDDLTDVWLHAADRVDVTRAQHTIEQDLRRDPKGVGHHLSEGLWSFTIPPLTVSYIIDDAQHVVTVTSVRRTS